MRRRKQREGCDRRLSDHEGMLSSILWNMGLVNQGREGASENMKGVAVISRNPLKFMVRLERFELPAYRFVACCSIQLSYKRTAKMEIR